MIDSTPFKNDSIKIFYSWQSDLENKFNRGFIKGVLESAVKGLNKNLEFYEAERELTLDHDTKDVPGTPDLTGTIFDKISSAAIFIADISFVAVNNSKNRKVANPNVLIELGYAISKLGSDRVLCVLNNATGKAEELPFDLKHKRYPIQYCLNEDSKDKANQKNRFIADLKEAITTILNAQKFKSIPSELSDPPTKEKIFNAIMASDSVDDWSSAGYDTISNTETIFYKKNVNLRFVFGFTEGHIQQAKFIEKWANKHPDAKATGYFIPLYFGYSHISNFILVSVDGGRALLPLPKSDTCLEVSPLDYKVAQIHDKLGSLNEYMSRSSLGISHEKYAVSYSRF